jgi:RNA polymerase sigma factor (TIGR02999 family)
MRPACFAAQDLVANAGMNPDFSHPPRPLANGEADDAAGEHFWNSTMLPLLEEIAERHLRGEREAITLEPADLVQEAYLRLSELSMPLNDRQHFVSMVSRAMRRVLVDRARRKQAAKRGNRPLRITLLSSEREGVDDGAIQLLELDSLLDDLGRADPRKAKLVELYYFSGLTRSEMAEVTGLSPATLGRELSFARTWIFAQMNAGR